MIQIEYILLIACVLILISVTISKFSEKAGIPALLLFIGVGMFAGSEGIGGIYFDDVGLAQNIGIIALIFILFAGGLDTKWSEVKPVIKPAVSLATIGVFLTAVIVGLFVSYIFNVSFLWGLLIGSIISSTDAAALFSIIRSRSISLKGGLKPLLEFESGSNDPMAIFLTIGTIQLLMNPEKELIDTILLFIFQMGIGLVLGLALGKLMVILINRMNFTNEGIYIVFSLALCILIFSFTAVIGGSGFLAIYISGLIIGNSSFIHKKGTIRFFDGLAVLSQIAMFLTLGLLVFPSKLMEILVPGLLICACLFFIARPLSVYLSLIFLRSDFKRYSFKEKIFISWVGLRGAVPIILATFPSIAGVPNADIIFNIVFFVVLTSVLLQGWSLTPVAKLLKLDEPLKIRRELPLQFNPTDNVDMELLDFIVPYNSLAVGKTLAGLSFPDDSRIVLIWRNEKSVIPGGGTMLEEGDTLLTLVNKNNISRVKEILSKQKSES
ncbi:MAG: potassium/proton antiporter [Ignavibacteria bacterium]|nr:potassium/proton antiporter [Ignavibacteria bacterium]